MGKKNRRKKIRKEKSLHDQAIEELKEKIKENYLIFFKKAIYYIPDSKDTIGEFDLVGISDQGIHIYEVKTDDSYEEAVEQFKRAREKLSGCGNIKTFYYSAKTKELTEIVFDSAS